VVLCGRGTFNHFFFLFCQSLLALPLLPNTHSCIPPVPSRYLIRLLQDVLTQQHQQQQAKAKSDSDSLSRSNEDEDDNDKSKAGSTDVPQEMTLAATDKAVAAAAAAAAAAEAAAAAASASAPVLLFDANEVILFQHNNTVVSMPTSVSSSFQSLSGFASSLRSKAAAQAAKAKAAVASKKAIEKKESTPNDAASETTAAPVTATPTSPPPVSCVLFTTHRVLRVANCTVTHNIPLDAVRGVMLVDGGLLRTNRLQFSLARSAAQSQQHVPKTVEFPLSGERVGTFFAAKVREYMQYVNEPRLAFLAAAAAAAAAADDDDDGTSASASATSGSSDTTAAIDDESEPRTAATEEECLAAIVTSQKDDIMD
jgi:hypothetical protein